METVNPSQIARTQEITAQIGRDMHLLIGRVSQLERNQTTPSDPVSLPSLPLPNLAGLLPANIRSSGDVDLGFVDLRLALADWSQWDVQFDGYDLSTETSLHTAILISVWTDARVGDIGGWWGDSYNDRPVAESLLWTLMGKPANADNVEMGIGYVKTALQWLLDDQWITAMDVTGEAQRDPQAHLDIFAFRIDHTDRNGNRGILYL
ncbi:MAG: hypothetical protein BWK73_04870 [Thiothrix lacustris]|uniref:Uncharacterized protein n=1 Tax=Thiothrix lacustris TaxID=525917 RepID=A0A1Y1QXT6_9GAMM|nr:MAG: hypothetical protein BWK73_04870 [Thiothrix lacustris]